jgi:nitrite reductase (NO-forming)
MHIRLLLAAAALALGLAACSQSQPQSSAAPPAVADAGTASGSLAFEGYELGYRPAGTSVEQPGTYTVTFTNAGHANHDWVGGGVRLVAKPGETVSGTVVVPAEGLEFVCSFPGHAPAGMRGRISVAAQAS